MEKFNSTDIEKIKKAGEIHKKVIEYSKSIVKKGVSLLEIADKIDAKILELGGKPAFPVNLSIDEVAAHATPAWNSEEKAHGLLKVDVGIHVDGFVADGAISLDLEDSNENRKLIGAAQRALDLAVKKFNVGVSLGEVGKTIQEEISSHGFLSVKNLSGHEIKQYDLHAGVTIPNVDSGETAEIEEGLYAIEPFSTNGVGRVRDGRLSGIYQLSRSGSVRDNFAREVLAFILEEYDYLPFCSRWIFKEFGSRGLLALRQIEQAGILHQYKQLVEESEGKVAQAEHTVLLSKNGKIVTTL